MWPLYTWVRRQKEVQKEELQGKSGNFGHTQVYIGQHLGCAL